MPNKNISVRYLDILFSLVGFSRKDHNYTVDFCKNRRSNLQNAEFNVNTFERSGYI